MVATNTIRLAEGVQIERTAKVMPSLSLEIAIAGGGIAGLMAAISLRKAGHRVTIYEQSRFANEVGAAIHLAPNATRVLLSVGFDPERACCVENGVSTSMDGVTKEMKTYTPLDHMRPTYGAPWYLIHRVDLHTELKRLALKNEGPGTPVVLKTASRIVSVNCQAPSLTLQDGSVVHCDLLIGADGVHSTVVNAITGQNNVARPTGFSAYRFLVPAKNLLADPQTQWLVKDQPVLMALFTAGDRRLAVYPCRSRELMNFVAIHPDRQENTKDDWNVSASIDGLLEKYKDFHPEILSFCKHAEDLEDVKIWPLLYRSPVRPWAKGNVCAIGDAVHPMLPHHGQGGGMAIEDGGCLGTLLSNISSKSQIAERLNLFQEIRFERASIVQIISNAGYDEVERMKEEAGRFTKSPLPRNQLELHKFFFTYNVLEDSTARLEKLLQSGEA